MVRCVYSLTMPARWILIWIAACSVHASVCGQQSAEQTDRGRARAFGALRAPVHAGYELREVAYRVSAKAKVPLLLTQLDGLGARRGAGLEAAKRLFAALDRAALKDGDQKAVVARTEHRWSVVYDEHVYREVELSKPPGSFPARVQTSDARISWNRDNNQLDIVLGTKGWRRRDLRTLMSPLPIAGESLRGMQQWNWRGDELKIDGRIMHSNAATRPVASSAYGSSASIPAMHFRCDSAASVRSDGR